MSGRSVRGGGRRFRIGLWSLAVLSALVLVLPAAASACREDGGGEDQPPTIGFAQMTPATLSYIGGKVVVSGEVGDDCGLVSVHGSVVGEETEVEYFEMEPVGPGSFVGTTVYQHELTLPSNFTEQPIHYVAVMEAEDTSFQVEHAFAGETEVEAAPAFDEPPAVEGAAIAPRSLGQAGGTVTISANAYDNRSVSVVFAILTDPAGNQLEVPMEPTSSSHFEGTYTAPANLGPTPQAYSAVVYAEDDIGQTATESAGDFTVAPLVTPGSGELVVHPTARLFGRVPLGKSSTRKIVVRDKARRGSAPVAASLAVSGEPFSIQGLAAPYEFLIGPKETRIFTLEFTPTAVGLFTGSAVVSRVDAGQAPVTVDLAGAGFEKRKPKPKPKPPVRRPHR
jgi:hypothetical protein